MSEYLPKPKLILEENTNIKLDLSNYATRADLKKNATDANTSDFAKDWFLKFKFLWG